MSQTETMTPSSTKKEVRRTHPSAVGTVLTVYVRHASGHDIGRHIAMSDDLPELHVIGDTLDETLAKVPAAIADVYKEKGVDARVVPNVDDPLDLLANVEPIRDEFVIVVTIPEDAKVPLS